MNVISKPSLMKMARKHQKTSSALSAWYALAKKAHWHGLHEVRQVFPSADQVGDVLIFDILGGNFRLIARISYASQRIYLKALLTHNADPQ